MKIEGVEHIGIAVANLDECIGKFEKLLGLKCKQRERSEPNRVEVAVFDCGGTRRGDRSMGDFSGRGRSRTNR